MKNGGYDFKPYFLGKKAQFDTEFDTQFKPVPDVSFERLPLRNDRDAAGIYCWVMTDEADRHCIYIGKTKSLSRRCGDYTRDFQPHSPNDYKLHIFFHEFMAELTPPRTLDLYFAEKTPSDLSAEEKAAIDKYNPLLNKLPKPTEEEREKLKAAFSFYYRSALKRKLRKEGTIADKI
jgi:excinuclease UvrABC nuclease subunit